MPNITIFDSGLGGISIHDAIRHKFPGACLTYCSDNEAFPYGSKTENELVERVSQVLTALTKQSQPDLLVIACNTASTVVLPKIRKLIKQPVIGVVPAVKPAAALAQGTHIALLATPGTIKRNYTQNLIDQYAPQFSWLKIGSSELVQLAEMKMYGVPPSPTAIMEIVDPLKKYPPETLDTVVLGCTHFPLLKTELQQILPHIKYWVDSTEAIANRVGFWLYELGYQECDRNGNPHHTLFFTGRIEKKEQLDSLLKEQEFSKLDLLQL